MLEFLYYLCLAKEIALVFIKVVILVSASVLMIVGLFAYLKRKEKPKEKFYPIAFWKQVEINGITLLVHPDYFEIAVKMLKKEWEKKEILIRKDSV